MEVPSNYVKEFREKFITKAETLIKESFPAKVQKLNKFLDEKFIVTDHNTLHYDVNVPMIHPWTIPNELEPSNKKRKIDEQTPHVTPNGPLKAIPLNENLLEFIDCLKPEIKELMENCNTVKTWIQLLIPRIEDGNNFGVSIQEDVLGEVTRIEGEAATFLDQISRYYITRGKVVSKVVKYPHIVDYRRTVEELDEKEYTSLKICCCELRNHYMCLHDAITKNMDKIIKPRSSNTDSLY